MVKDGVLLRVLIAEDRRRTLECESWRSVEGVLQASPIFCSLVRIWYNKQKQKSGKKKTKHNGFSPLFRSHVLY